MVALPKLFLLARAEKLVTNSSLELVCFRAFLDGAKRKSTVEVLGSSSPSQVTMHTLVGDASDG